MKGKGERMTFRNDIPMLIESLTRGGFGSYDKTYQDYYVFDSSNEYATRELAKVLSDGFKTIVNFFTGASKVVFAIPQRDYVVKIPFNGSEADYGSEYIDEYGDICYESDYQFDKFAYADCNTGEGNSWDYCEQEAIVYSKAVELGIGDMFAGTVKIANVHDYPIYASEKAETYSQVDYGSSSTNETVRQIFTSVNENSYRIEKTELYKIGKNFSEMCDDMGEFSSPDRMNFEFLGYMINYYGEKKVRTLCAFLDENGLNDFHSSNIGFIGDRPVLIDYSGFFDDN